MLSKRLLEAMNDQINAEFHSAYLYLSMAAYFDSQNLTGFSNWMQVQFREELEHGLKLYRYIYDRGGSVTLTTIEGPQTTWDSPLAAFEAAYNHEVMITGRINNLMKIATEESDFASTAFLQWFVTEQVEEEASTGEVVERLKRIGDHPHGLYMIDRELGQRQAAPPTAAESAQ